MPSKCIGCIHKGQVGKRWSLRKKAYRRNPKDKSCNAGRPEYNMQLQAVLSTKPTKEDWPSSVRRVRLHTKRMRAR